MMSKENYAAHVKGSAPHVSRMKPFIWLFLLIVNQHMQHGGVLYG